MSFTAATDTDVEVAVLDAHGKIIRHLAAGVLGNNAPAPFLKGSLKQSLTWDGQDDRGNLAVGGPFQVRVGLGLAPTLKGFLGDNPAALHSVRGLAVGPNGDLYVTHVFGELHPGDGSPTIAVFDRTGRYLRTLFPFPADTPDDRLHGVKRLTREDGSKVPFLYQAETRSYLPGAGDLPPHQPVVTKDGRFAFVGIQEGPHRYAQAGLNQVLVLRTEGGVPSEGPLGTVLAKSSRGGANLALSPDEATVYVSGLRQGGTGEPTHTVFAFGWKDKEPRVFAGTPGKAGAGEKQLNSPRGISVDAEGNIYVADRDNNRVVLFKPDGSYLGALSTDRPERVAVHPKTGAVYVLGGDRIDTLRKYSSWKDPKAVAEAKIPSFKHPDYTCLMALDATAEKPALWFASPKGYYARFDLLRIEDTGTAFSKPVDVGKANEAASPAVGPVMGMDFDRVHNRLLINTKAYDVAAEKWMKGINESSGKSINSMGVGSFGLDGNFYSQIFPKIVRRIGPDLKPIPFKGPQTSTRGDLLSPFAKGDMRVRGRGITADADGNMYILWEDQDTFGRGAAYNQLYLHASDGSVKKACLVEGHMRALDSVRVDSAGNVYLALALRPRNDLLPPALKGQVPDSDKEPAAVGELNTYPLIYGSIVKFGPEGGTIRTDIGGVPCNFAFNKPMEVKGAKWIYSGASPVVSWRTPGTPDICNCESARFDVDGFGRSIFPDAALCRVGILDTNGNLITRFGQYGNPDSKGPAIPMLWPYCISAGDGVVFVGDRLNRRVVRVALNPMVSETLAIP